MAALSPLHPQHVWCASAACRSRALLTRSVNQGAVHALTTALSRISRTRLSEVPHSAPLHGRATGDTHTANWQTQAVLEVLWRGWEECGAPDQDTLSVSGTKKQCLVLRCAATAHHHMQWRTHMHERALWARERSPRMPHTSHMLMRAGACACAWGCTAA